MNKYTTTHKIRARCAFRRERTNGSVSLSVLSSAREYIKGVLNDLNENAWPKSGVKTRRMFFNVEEAFRVFFRSHVTPQPTTDNNDRHRSETVSSDQKPMEPVETFLLPFVSSRVSSGFFLLETACCRVLITKREEDQELLLSDDDDDFLSSSSEGITFESEIGQRRYQFCLKTIGLVLEEKNPELAELVAALSSESDRDIRFPPFLLIFRA